MVLRTLPAAAALLIVMPAHANGEGAEFAARLAGHVIGLTFERYPFVMAAL